MRSFSSFPRPVRWATALSVAFASGIAYLFSAQSPARAAHVSTAPLSFLVKQQSAATPDPAFPKAGDTLVVIQKNLRGGRVIGQDSTACIVTNSTGLIQCTATVKLPGGFFEVAFPEKLGETNIMAPISSATGRFSGTTGYFTLHQLSPTEYRATLHARR
jgi:hypothetical protein